jgi:VCBS repeat-containing protein
MSGFNQRATISGLFAGGVIDDRAAANVVGGTLTVTDADAGQSVFQAVGAAALNGIHGSFAFDGLTGAWSYTLDNSRAATQALNRAERVVETLRVTSLDGAATRDIRATVVGANDRATICGVRRCGRLRDRSRQP